MPVILEPGSTEMKAWLDPTLTTWTKELQSALKPYEGELDCYQVPKEVGKVGNDSPSFILPISNKDNKKNIANFFANAKKPVSSSPSETTAKSREDQEPKSPPAAAGRAESATHIEGHGKRHHSPEKNGDEAKRRKIDGESSPDQSPTAEKMDANSQKITSFFSKKGIKK